MLHIVFLCPHSDPQANLGEPDSGGQCLYEHQLAVALSKLDGIKVTAFTRQTYQRPDVSIVNDSYSVIRIACGEEKFIPKEEIDRVLDEFTRKVKEKIELEPDVVVHAHYWDGGKAALLLKALVTTRIPMVWTPHSLGWLKRQSFIGREEEMTYKFIPRVTWETYVAFLADANIVSSDKEKKMIQKEYSLGNEIIHVIAPGVDMSDLTIVDQKKARKRLNLPTDGKILLCLGRIARTKSYQYAIRAIPELQKLYTNPMYLIICGGNAKTATPEEREYLGELQGLVKELGLEKIVLFHPALPHKRVNEMYSSADVKLLVSENEPFGLTAIEAMAMKVPVVAASSAGISSVLQHNQTGILVDIHKPKRIAYAVLALLKDKIFHAKVAKQAYEYVKETYAWEAIVPRYVEVYRHAKGQYSDAVFRKWIDENHFLQKNLL